MSSTPFQPPPDFDPFAPGAWAQFQKLYSSKEDEQYPGVAELHNALRNVLDRYRVPHRYEDGSSCVVRNKWTVSFEHRAQAGHCVALTVVPRGSGRAGNILRLEDPPSDHHHFAAATLQAVEYWSQVDLAVAAVLGLALQNTEVVQLAAPLQFRAPAFSDELAEAVLVTEADSAPAWLKQFAVLNLGSELAVVARTPSPRSL